MSQFLAAPAEVEEFKATGYLKLRVRDCVLNCIHRIFDAAPGFFRRSETAKQADALPSLNEGWRNLGGEFSIDPERPDLHESFWVTPRYERIIRSKYSPLGISLYHEMRHYISMLGDIERTITSELVNFVTNGSAATPGFSCDRDSDLQALYYQPSLHNRECLQEPHDDSLYMTFLKADRPGLELLCDDGRYRGIQLREDELIIMPGEILALLTGYKIKPQIHRVVRHENQTERIALGYFTYPNIEPGSTIMPWVSNATNDNVDIMERVIRNQEQFLINDTRRAIPPVGSES